ncbi:phosphotransferase [Streptomyces sp. NRRL S-87]|uniref:phosphotransferase n=1 Tax=Streptomyces sp. NRRL S-87 TaxID=1463920 RepID=UPI0004C131EC|nr:phosphotransferase [Streptomyces sp. NRRL S-87]
MTFTKQYPSPQAAARAAAHHMWLRGTTLPVPALIAQHPHALEFENAPGRHATPQNLPRLGRILGRAHATAYRRHLAHVRLDQQLALPSGGVIPSFTADRTTRVHRLLATGAVPDPAFTPDQAADLITSAAAEPAAFYKDANPRNFLTTPTTTTAVDFDDLTLAPFGYDLAKLIVTTAMTHGPLPDALQAAALHAYNQVVPHPCSPSRLALWMEIHHILTSPYTGRNGYAHSWHTLRPGRTA